MNVVESGMSAIENKAVDLAGMNRASRMMRILKRTASIARLKSSPATRAGYGQRSTAATWRLKMWVSTLSGIPRNTPRSRSRSHAWPRIVEPPRVIVRDHGPRRFGKSISIFHFKTIHRTGKTGPSIGGTGIGLAITDTAVRLHEGSVQARNAPDGGLIVEMSFPAS